MNTTAKAHEPTMEEILASIRRIISDDEPAPSAKGATPLKPAETIKPQEPTQDSLGQDDIDAMLASFDEPEPAPAMKPQPAAKAPAMSPSPLERSDASPRAAASVSAMATPHVAPKMALGDDIDVFELTDEMATYAPEPAAAPMAIAPRPAQERLISAATDEAVSAAFGSLAHTMMSNNGRTIDDLVKELLKPMLRSWLDDNLPPLVERLVRQEIERVARGGR